MSVAKTMSRKLIRKQSYLSYKMSFKTINIGLGVVMKGNYQTLNNDKSSSCRALEKLKFWDYD